MLKTHFLSLLVELDVLLTVDLTPSTTVNTSKVYNFPGVRWKKV